MTKRSPWSGFYKRPIDERREAVEARLGFEPGPKFHREEGMTTDVIIVGSGIVGMACAWAALQQGKRVQVIDRDPYCVGASIRNFGFVTVTGQGSGDTWRRARRSSDVWAQIAPLADIPVEHAGLWVLAQRQQYSRRTSAQFDRVSQLPHYDGQL